MTHASESYGTLSPDAQVTITGRHVEVPDHFAERVNSKLAKIEHLDPTLTFFHVELQHEPNPRRAEQSDKIQITATGKGHICRAEAAEDSFYAALETAVSRMERSLRKVKARRKIARSGHRVPLGAGEAAVAMEKELEQEGVQPKPGDVNFDVDPYADLVQDSIPGQIVRTKSHPSTPVSVDEALSEMELVGHDFYLFVNEETGRPSVVYRRRAFDYGLISLDDTAER